MAKTKTMSMAMIMQVKILTTLVIHKTIYVMLIIGLTSCYSDKRREILLNPNHKEWSQQAPPFFNVEFYTSNGQFVIEIERNLAPLGADRFYNLVRHGYYNDARFHRVVKDFIVQFGIAGDAKVSQIWKNQFIPDDPVIASNTKGALAYAFTYPRTRSTQLYINMTDNTRLDTAGFAPFGRVIVGMGVVESIYSGYGENSGGGVRRGDQSKILARGNNYLDSEFPKLDEIIEVKVLQY